MRGWKNGDKKYTEDRKMGGKKLLLFLMCFWYKKRKEKKKKGILYNNYIQRVNITPSYSTKRQEQLNKGKNLL